MKIEKLSSYRDIVYSGLGAASEGPDLTLNLLTQDRLVKSELPH